MCGRYLLYSDIEELLERYRILNGWTDVNWGGEIFPTQTVPVVINRGSRELVPLKWGFTPSYVKSPVINARSETAVSKPMFRNSLAAKRCIIPANAFFEWKKDGQKKIKHKIYVKQLSIFSMAGIYDEFPDKEGKLVTAFSILTTAANPLVAQVHDRMPVILTPEAEDMWLDPDITDPRALAPCLTAFDADRMAMEPV